MNETRVVQNTETEAYWAWLNKFVAILGELTANAERSVKNGEAVDGKHLAELRGAERTLNFTLDSFMDTSEKRQSVPVTIYLATLPGSDGLKPWNEIKRKRDEIADRIATLIENDPAALKRFQEYCEHSKNPRSLGSML